MRQVARPRTTSQDTRDYDGIRTKSAATVAAKGPPAWPPPGRQTPSSTLAARSWRRRSRWPSSWRRTAGQIAAECTDWRTRASTRGRFLKLTAITHQRFSSPLWSGDEVRKAPRDCRDRAGRGALAMVHVRPKRPSIAPLRERWRGCTGPLGAAGRPLRPNWLGKRLPRGGDR